jgi:hypothetical protein
LGVVFLNYSKKLTCRRDSNNGFVEGYLQILKYDIPDEYFMERQAFPETYVELEKRDFSGSYEMLNTPELKSYVANSNGSYVAYFRLTLETRSW